MSNISLFEKPWIDLVFENRNKSYGAYVLRRNDGRTTLLAFLSGLCIIGIATLIPMLVNALADRPVEDTGEIYTIPTVTLSKIIPKVTPPTVVQKASPVKSTAAKTLRNPVVTNASQADDIIKPQVSTTDNTIDTPISGSQVTSHEVHEVTTAEPPKDPTVIKTTAEVDRLPEFPGGLAKFYEFVSANFANVEVDETVTVLTSFVVEVDGSISDIRVLRNPGYGLDKEAIRVLQSLHVKWKSGVKDGVPVRTRYNFPIKVKSN